MPFVENEGVKTHYKVEGEGFPLVLIHGFPGGMYYWYDPGYVDAFQDEFQLILLDLRGHGLSDKPQHSTDYSLKTLTADIVAVMDALEIVKAHVWGWSWGGGVALMLAKYYPERFSAFIIGGAFPHKLTKSQITQWKEFERLFAGDATDYIKALEDAGREITPEYRKTIESWDFTALYAQLQGVDLVKWEEASHIKELDTPFLFYEGELTPPEICRKQKDYCQQMKNAQSFCIPHVGHEVQLTKSKLVIPNVLKFLQNLDPSHT